MWELDGDPRTDPGEQVMWPKWLHIVYRLSHRYTDLSKLCIKQEKARQTRDYCESIITSVIDSLQRHYLSVWQLVGAQEQAVTAKVQITLQTLKAAMEETKKRDAELAHLAHTESDVCFLQASELMYNLLYYKCNSYAVKVMHTVCDQTKAWLKEIIWSCRGFMDLFNGNCRRFFTVRWSFSWCTGQSATCCTVCWSKR